MYFQFESNLLLGLTSLSLLQKMDLNKEAAKLKYRFEKLKERKNEDVKNDSLEIQTNSLEASNEEKLAEYFNFLRNLPILPAFEMNRLISLVKKEWDINNL